MTTANKVSLFRILLVPVFIGFAVYYGQSVAEGHADEMLRLGTIGVFALAAIGDAFDGWLARRFNQKTRLGAVLDPLADKLLMVSAVIVLSFTPWPQRFPIWFPLTLLSRDVLSSMGAGVIYYMNGTVRIRPHWTGKVATGAQITALLWVMLDIRTPSAIWSAGVAAVFTFVSGMFNLANGIQQIQSNPHA